MQITLSELKMNTGRYVTLAEHDDIIITRNGKRVARLTSLRQEKTAAAKALFGLIRDDVDLDAEREERVNAGRS